MSAGTQQVPIPWTPAPPQLVMAYSVCKGITRTAAKNFYYAFLVLPRRKREALCAVYAFMRRCDDIADDPALSLPDRRQKLDIWLDALHRAQQGEPTDTNSPRIRTSASVMPCPGLEGATSATVAASEDVAHSST